MAGVKGQRSGGHNAKTTAEHIAQGTYQKCRHGDRLDNQPADGEPIKPAGLSQYESDVWDEMVGYLPAAAVGLADTVMLREAARWYGIYTRCMELLQADPIDRDLMLSTDKAWKNFDRIACQFGATPIARARLQLKPGGDVDEDSATGKGPLAQLYQSRN